MTSPETLEPEIPFNINISHGLVLALRCDEGDVSGLFPRRLCAKVLPGDNGAEAVAHRTAALLHPRLLLSG